MILAVTLAGHVAALGLAFACYEIALAGSVVAALLAVVIACQRRRSMAFRRLKSFSKTGRFAMCGLRFAAHVPSLAWLFVGLKQTDESLRLLSNVLVGVGAPVSFCESLALLVLQLAVLAKMGRVQQARDIGSWGPFAVFALSWLSRKVHAYGQAPAKDGPVVEEEEGDTAARRKKSFFRKSLRILPDWVPPSKSEIKAFQQQFSLDDELLGVYVCTVRQRLSHQGQLFVSSQTGGVPRLCFHGLALLRSALEFVISLDELHDVVRQSGSRDTAVLVFKRPTQMRGIREPVSELSLRVGERGLNALNAIFSVQRSLGVFDEDSSGWDMDDDASLSNLDDPAAAVLREPFNWGDDPWANVMEVRIPRLQLRPIADDLLAEEWGPSSLMRTYHDALGATEFAILQRVDDSDVASTVHILELSFTMPLPPAPMCPKVTKVTATCRISVEATQVNAEPAVTIEFSVVSHDVPFGSNFVVQERLELKPDDNAVRIVKSCRTIFLKSVGFLKSRIQSSSASEGARTGNAFVEVVERHAGFFLPQRSPSASPISKPCSCPNLGGAVPAPPAPPAVGSAVAGAAVTRERTTCTGRVWELQRRTTLFQKDWRAPFLPHDADKRWRWVDDDYNKHCWVHLANRDLASLTDFPPLTAPGNWKEQGRWRVVTDDPDTMDQDGWQYSIDFYRSENFWSSRSKGMHCRRRLWTCTLTEEKKEEKKPGSARERRAAG